MVFNLSKYNPLAAKFISEIRDSQIQQDRMRFRHNMERLGMAFAYEISQKMPVKQQEVVTPLGTAKHLVLSQQPVLATILRAGLPLHNGLLQFFDQADNAFIAAYRKHHKSGEFSINLEYVSCPSLEGRILIIADPMLATGASMVLTIDHLLEHGTPASIHVVAAIASRIGIEAIHEKYPDAFVWAGAVDEELTARGYIVPGLGDAGDLAFGTKKQE